MAEIVLGLATSHGPLLSTPPDKWHILGADDKKNPRHYYKKKVLTYDELLAERQSSHFDPQLSTDVSSKRHAACRVAIDTLAKVFAETAPDIAVIFGDDQMEMFTEANIPAFSVFYGDSIEHAGPTDVNIAKIRPGIAIAMKGHSPAEPTTYTGVPELGRHIIDALIKDHFDVTAMKAITGAKHGATTAPHAYGFIYRQIMQDRVVPNVPVVLNTFYPPNQPTVQRCYDFGRSISRAIRSWKSDARVALIASGGLTHFVIDEDTDRIILDAMARNAIGDIAELSEATFQSGTSEIKNWIPVVAAMGDLDYPMTLVDYVPCYRSEAGTGNAMGFAYWRAK